jgi:hypothetical protein
MLLIQAARRSSSSLDLVVRFAIAWSAEVDSADSLNTTDMIFIASLGYVARRSANKTSGRKSLMTQKGRE